jgi:hypothetical protein
MNDTHERLTLAWLTYMEECQRFHGKGIKIAASRANRALRLVRSLSKQRSKELTEARNKQ